MPGVLLVNALDASRALGPRLDQATPAQVEHFFLTDYLPRRGGGFNQTPRSLRQAISSEVGLLSKKQHNTV
jgi:hypothetical protein